MQVSYGHLFTNVLQQIDNRYFKEGVTTYVLLSKRNGFRKQFYVRLDLDQKRQITDRLVTELFQK
jgi:hypothetical protein